jgi:hypothetical protein
LLQNTPPRKPYHHYNDFLDEVDNYETELEENRAASAQKICLKYLTKPQGEFRTYSSIPVGEIVAIHQTFTVGYHSVGRMEILT